MSGELFTGDDLALLDKAMRLRTRLIDKIASVENTALSTKASDLLAVTGLLDSLDKSVFTKAKLVLEEGSAKSDEETRKVLLSLMTDLHSNSGSEESGDAGSVPEYVPTGITVMEGELIQGNDAYTGGFNLD